VSSELTHEELAKRRRGNWLLVSALAAAIAIVVIPYPYVIESALARFGVRPVAFALLSLALAAALLGGRSAVRRSLPASLLASAPLLVLGAAALSGQRSFLLLVPPLAYSGLALTCAHSLRGPGSLIEDGVRYLVPEAPDFVRSYCRKLTGLWMFFFLLAALASAVCAFAADPETWRRVTGTWVYGAMLAISIFEFFFRKTWFRYYFHNGLFDRVWSRLFPAENTERGRASQIYIDHWREVLNRPQEPSDSSDLSAS